MILHAVIPAQAGPISNGCFSHSITLHAVIPAQARIHFELMFFALDHDRRMRGLLQKLMQGVDPGAPGAFWKILHNMLVLVPWWPLFWFTVASAIAGAIIGWWRGRVALGVGLALLVGPLGWIALWALPPGPYGPARQRLDRREADAATRH